MDEATYERIGKEIHSDASPVGIDAKKTHILILVKLEEMGKQLAELQKKVSELSS